MPREDAVSGFSDASSWEESQRCTFQPNHKVGTGRTLSDTVPPQLPREPLSKGTEPTTTGATRRSHPSDMLETPVAAHQKAASGSARRQSNQSLPEPFVFVPITSGEAAKGRGAAKRIVRAHVTRVQHAKSSALPSHNLENWTVKPYIHRDTAPARRKPRPSGATARRRTVGTEKDGEPSEQNDDRALVVVPKLATGA